MKSYHIPVILLILFSMSACDLIMEKPESWAPGAPDAEDSIGIYFDEDNPVSLVMIPGEGTPIEIVMHRIVTEGGVDVPIITTCDVEGLVFPERVHFDAGSADASFRIDYSKLPQKVTASYTISVPDEYLYMYNDSRLNSHGGKILVSAWESANVEEGKPVRFIFTENNCIKYVKSEPASFLYRTIESEMEILPGAGLYRVRNFLDSGADFVFSLEASQYPKYKNYWRIVPQEDYYYTLAEAYEDEETYGDAYYNAWFLLDGIEDYAIPSIKMFDGTAVEMSSMTFYWYSDSNASEYSYARLAGTVDDEGVTVDRCTASMWTAIGSNYLYLYFSWDKSAQ